VEQQQPLVIVCGPTGSGKSALSVALAERFAGEVVNCDSVQLYRYFDVGTAKITVDERRGVPHHLIDIAQPEAVFTAGDYARLARAALAEISGRGSLPIVAGGTGFYLRALMLGLFEGPSRNHTLRQRLQEREARRSGSLHRLLQRWDAAAARRIHRNDTNKITRALEVIVTEKQSLTTMFERGRDPLTGYRVLWLGLNPPRAELYTRLERRARLMFEHGLIEEVQALLERGTPETAKPFESLGYAQALACVRGSMGLEQAIAETQMYTRRYAKRQWTWFRREPGVEWVDGFGGDPSVQRSVVERVTRFLASS
jgi:tRNA dimethylallyltransferase